jgi:membrane associated rhomboid family serine protease
VTHALIALNLGVFLFMTLLTASNEDLAERIGSWGAVGRDFAEYGIVFHEFGIWQLITSAFFHGGFMHIFGNMIFLLVFGPSVEDRFGRIGYLVFYLGGAIVSALAHMGVEEVPAIGASGAVAAVSGAYLVLFPRTRIKCFVFFLIIGVFFVPSWWLIGLYIVLDLLSQAFTPDNGIANMAHLGGYAMGIVVAFALLGTKILEREPYDLLSILKHRQRRRAFASATRIHDQQMSRVRTNGRKPAPLDPKAEQIAHARAQIGSLLNEGNATQAADAYQRMLEEFGHDTNAPLTLHREAQYQIANTLYQREDRVAAADAFERLLASYPADPERGIIRVLIARTRAWDQEDFTSAIAMLESLKDDTLDDETRSLVESELDQFRQHASNAQPPTPQEPES